MMSSRFQLLFIVFFLTISGLSLAFYKVVYLDVPLIPHQKRSLFAITASIELQKNDNPIVVSMSLPQPQDGMQIVSSEVDSGDFGYTVSHENNIYRATWAKRELENNSKIFYKTILLADSFYKAPIEEVSVAANKLKEDQKGLWEESEQSAAKLLLDYVHSHSADDVTFVAQLITLFNSKQPMEAVNTLLQIKGETKISLISALMKHENIVFRKLRGIELIDGQKDRKLITMLKVKSDDKWYLYSLKDAQISKPDNFFVWHDGNSPLLITKGEAKAKLRFSVTETKVSATKIAKNMIKEANAEFLDFSLYTLPSLQQNAFKQILLVPIGALIVVIMRILIGIRTMGTFMPILFSLAFIQTTLISGILMFVVIIGIGLFVRGYLSRLRLLLVARISAVIIVVIAIMSIMSIVSYKLGLEDVLKITFFPMIILAWTIERMSILWEEEGSHEALIQGGGSLIIAVIAYFAMDNVMVRYITFNFPELLLVILALIILIGRYTGYRLSELIRFVPLGK